jgi:thioredoxin-dependent peroxiredoxin
LGKPFDPSLEAAMLRSLLAVTFLVLGSHLSFAQEAKPVKLKAGDKAPAFQGKTDEGKPWKSKDHVGKKILVVYFYPKDQTPGCTAQACSYRDMQKEFADKDVEIIGVSGDTVESHQAFKKAEKLNFTLLADPEGKIAAAFGVPVRSIGGGLFASRWTFIIGPDGKIAHKDEKVDAGKDSATVLKVIKKLEKAKS